MHNEILSWSFLKRMNHRESMPTTYIGFLGNGQLRFHFYIPHMIGKPRPVERTLPSASSPKPGGLRLTLSKAGKSREPSPVDMVNIPLFIGFHTSQVGIMFSFAALRIPHTRFTCHIVEHIDLCFSPEGVLMGPTQVPSERSCTEALLVFLDWSFLESVSWHTVYFNFGMFPVVLQWFSSRFGAKKGTCKFRVPNSHGKKPWKMMQRILMRGLDC